MVQSGRSPARRSALVASFLLLAASSKILSDGPAAKPATGKAPAEKADAEKKKVVRENPLLFYHPRVQAIYAAAQVLEMTYPLGALGLLKADASLHMWQDLTHRQPPPGNEEPATPEPRQRNKNDPTVDRDLLSGIEDERPLRNAEQNYDEALAYGFLLTRAHSVPAEEFRKRARTDLTLAHMLDEPAKYRGEIIHITGGLRRLREFDAPRRLWKEGVRKIYEGWIYPRGYPANPICVVVTDLPQDLAVSEKFAPPIDVSFDGYLFKKYRYTSGEIDSKTKTPIRYDTPLLIGPTLNIAKTEEIPVDPQRELANLMPYIAGVVVGTILLVSGLTWWFRRGDREVQSRLDTARASAFVEPNPDGEPPRPAEPEWTNEPEPGSTSVSGP